VTSRSLVLLAAAPALLLATTLPAASRAAPQPGSPPQGAGVPRDESIPTIRIVGAARPKIPIALPAFQTVGGEDRLREAARTMRDVVRDDLDFSGYFQIIPEDYLKLVKATGDPRIDFKEYLGVGAESLLVGKVDSEPNTVVFEGRVYDTGEKRMLLGKRYRGEPELARVMAHRLSNEIVQQYTGQPGLALTKIAFVSQVGRGKEIYVMDYDGARVKRVTANGAINLSPCWSPDGSQIAFVSYRTGSPELVILSSEGELRKAFPQSGELNSAPAWSPDGRLLAFSSSRDGNAEIYTLRPADGALTRLTRNDAIDTSPTWSPNGKFIAFTSDRSGAPQIYVMSADGTNARRLTYDVSYCDAASWSPLGDKIVFTGRVPGGFDLYIKEVPKDPSGDLAGGAINRLTENSNINEWPRWSPDGRHIVFASNRTGNFDIYTMEADGSNVRRLTRGGNSSSPSWSR
jgi:TolB protein